MESRCFSNKPNFLDLPCDQKLSVSLGFSLPSARFRLGFRSAWPYSREELLREFPNDVVVPRTYRKARTAVGRGQRRETYELEATFSTRFSIGGVLHESYGKVHQQTFRNQNFVKWSRRQVLPKSLHRLAFSAHMLEQSLRNVYAEVDRAEALKLRGRFFAARDVDAMLCCCSNCRRRNIVPFALGDLFVLFCPAALSNDIYYSDPWYLKTGGKIGYRG